MPRIVAVADTHSRHNLLAVPDGDIFIHAGDLTWSGTEKQIIEAVDYFAALPHKHKIIIAGNHDFGFEHEPAKYRKLLTDLGLIYLHDEEVTVDGLRIYGSPYQPRFYDWAFNLNRGSQIAAKWAKIPSGLDILVTHGPPYGYGDDTGFYAGGRVGCVDLLGRVKVVKPRYHLFGHIHENKGIWKTKETTYVNVTTAESNEPATVLDI